MESAQEVVGLILRVSCFVLVIFNLRVRGYPFHDGWLRFSAACHRNAEFSHLAPPRSRGGVQTRVHQSECDQANARRAVDHHDPRGTIPAIMPVPIPPEREPASG